MKDFYEDVNCVGRLEVWSLRMVVVYMGELEMYIGEVFVGKRDYGYEYG